MPNHVVVNKRVVERSILVKFKKNSYKDALPVPDRYIETVEHLGVVNDGKGLELHIPDEVMFSVSGKIATLKLSRFEKVVGLCPGARHFTKRWPAERFAHVGGACVESMDAKILVFGGREDESICNQICKEINDRAGEDRATNCVGQLGLLETAAAMEYCDVVITNDTGLMHIATAMRKKIIALFGSTVREFGFYPYDPTAVVLERSGLECRPCTHIGRSECPESHFRCMLEISEDEVLSQARSICGRPAAG